MARTVQVHVLDDLDGTPADETVRFSLDGVSFEIDLSAGHSEELRKTLARYIVAGRRASGGIVTGGRPARGAASASTTRAQNQAIRAWAKESGLDVSERGRIPGSLIDRFKRESGA